MSEFQKLALKNVLKIAENRKKSFLLKMDVFIYRLNLGVFMHHIRL